MSLIFLGKYLIKVLPGVKEVIVYKDFITIKLLSTKYLLSVLFFLKNSSQLKAAYLLDIWAVDYPEQENRFEINYLICSISFNFRLIIKIFVKDQEGISSCESLFSSAGWLEREVWDMFGVFFFNNSDLRRILTDYGFLGYPLRKDFPLSGYLEMRYDDGQKRVLQEPLEIAQEYREFNFKSPWEN